MSKEYWPGTEIEKSDWSMVGLRQSDADWDDLFRSSAARAAQTEVVAAKRQEGVDLGAVYGISRKSDEALRKHRHGGAYTRAKPSGQSKAASLREFLKTGPKNAAELGRFLGEPSRTIRAHLQDSVNTGKVRRILNGAGGVMYQLAWEVA